MSLMQARGGIPHILREAITTTGRHHLFPAISFYLKIRVKTAALKIYFTEADFTNDANYIEIDPVAAATPYGEWSGPVESKGLWLKASSGTSDIELVSFNRRA